MKYFSKKFYYRGHYVFVNNNIKSDLKLNFIPHPPIHCTSNHFSNKFAFRKPFVSFLYCVKTFLTLGKEYQKEILDIQILFIHLGLFQMGKIYVENLSV